MASAAQIVGAPASLAWTSSTSEDAVLAITQPDGTAASAPSVTSSGAAHTASFTPDQPGRHVLTWTADSGEVFVDVLDVWPAAPRYLVAVADVLSRLGSSAAPGASDKKTDLQLYIAAATWVIEESYTGPIAPEAKTWTEYMPRARRSILLPYRPVEVTSVSINDAALAAGDYRVDEQAGVIHAYGQEFYESVEVAYTVGDNIVPPPVRLACIELVAHQWQGQRESNRVQAPVEDTVTTSVGYAIPKRVAEMLSSVAKRGGFA